MKYGADGEIEQTRLNLRRRRQLNASLVLAVACTLASSAVLAGNLKAVMPWDIKAGTLDQALLQVGTEAHMQINFSSKSATVAVRTRGIKGRYTGKQVLAQLLTGTGLTYVVVGDTISIRLEPKSRAGTRARAGGHLGLTSNPQPGESMMPLSSSGVSRPQPPQFLQEVIVTGTHIADVAPISPITTISAEDIRDSGLPDIASVINAMPQVFSGGANPGVVVSGGINGDASNVDSTTANLRGIGALATLTLINGHRMVGSGGAMAVDVSSIPTAAVERVDIETDGASAIYGADAVAGVVNIVLKKNYDGQHTEAYVGDTADGGLVQRYSQLVGRSFDAGRGDAMLGYQFQSSQKVLASQRRVSQAAGDGTTLQPQAKSQSLFLSSHYQLARNLQGDVEGIYNHRTSLAIFEGGDQQGLEDQFWGNGGLKWGVGDHRTVGADVTYSGDSSAVVEYGAFPARFSNQNRLLELSVNGQGRLVRLPGDRVLRMAIGGGATREAFKTGSASSFAPVVNEDRRRSFAYVEEFIPIFPSSTHRPGLRRLVLNVAGRFDHYSDFGSIVVPKVQLAYSPLRSLALSATWGRSFEPPTLDQLYQGQFVIRYPGSFFGLPPAREVMFVTGSNQHLRPQTAMTRTVTLQWEPRLWRLRGLTARLTYYDIDFNDQVGSPITDTTQALSNPLYSPFVVEQPSAALQNSVISGATVNYNFFNLPVAPADVQALVFDNAANVSAQVIDGLDANVEYRRPTRLGVVGVSISGSWMRFDQRALPGVMPVQISGTIFNPPRVKSRAMLSLDRHEFGLSLFVNYVSSELNNAVVPRLRLGSWTTVDGQVRYRVQRGCGLLSRMQISLSVQNLFDRAPPSIPASATIPSGIGFDADNYSALGRFISLDAAFRW